MNASVACAVQERQGGVVGRIVVRTVVLEQRTSERIVGRVGVGDRRATGAPQQRLVSVAQGHGRLVPMPCRERHDLVQHLAIAIPLGKPRRSRALGEYRVETIAALPGTHLDPISARLGPDAGSPPVGIVDLLALPHHVAARQESAVVVAAVDALDQVLGTTTNLDRIHHGLRDSSRGFRGGGVGRLRWMPWQIASAGEKIQPPGGADATVWRWQLIDEQRESRTVLVKITGTAMAAQDVHFRLDHARRSEGQTEVSRVLDWDEPPEEIAFGSASEVPDFIGGDPGPEVAELAEIAAWFQERGIVLVWTGRGVGVSPETAKITTHSANLIDQEADKLVARFEAPWRVDAVREAQRWWIENKPSESAASNGERKGRIVEGSAHLVGESHLEASGEVTRPHVPRDDLDALVRHGRAIWFTEPDPDDPESRWMAEVWNVETGTIIEVATGYTAEEAFVIIRPSVLPPDDRAPD